MSAKASERRQPSLQTVDRALSVLEFVARSPEPPTIRGVAEGLTLNITTCYHLFHTLNSRGYLRRDTALRLHLGNKIAGLYSQYRDKYPVLSDLSRIIDGLAADTAETAYLSVLEDGALVVRVLVEGSHALKVGGLYLGLSGREHQRASGKAVLPHLPAPEREDILARALADLPEDERAVRLARFREEMGLVIQRGWSIDDQESDLGVVSIGCPVFAEDGRVYGALGVVGPSVRMEASLQTYIDTVKAAAGEAGAALSGWH
ncbi:IclR family transcriptional regulator [Okibacterium endophyticum]